MRLPYEARKALGVLLVPLSVIPFVLVAPMIVRQERELSAHRDRGALPRPDAPIAVARARRWAPFAPARGAVPVLAYHGIGDARDGFSVTRRDFALQMAMLARAGFDTIGPAQYARFLAGDRRGLPPRPVLVTFDDGRLDSFRGADAVLARHGFRATMFVITGPVDAGHPFYLRWDELRAMRRSGRWDLQEHAADGHRRITVDAAGHEGPFFANRRYAGGRLETLAGFRDRVRADLAQARRALTREIPGYVPAAFAVPYGDFGQNRSNDRRVAPLMRALLGLTYTAVFTQNRAAYTTPATPRTDLQRYELHGGDTADALYDRLRADRPRPERR